MKKSKPPIDGKAVLISPAPKLSKKLQGELSVWESRKKECDGRIHKKMISLAYDIVEKGFYLLKIRELFRCGTVPHEDGFKGWLEINEPDKDRKSAYRAMWAAQNVGLTENSTQKAWEKIRDGRELDGRSLSSNDLYRSPKQISNGSGDDGGEGNGNNEQLEFNLVTETIKDWTNVREALVKLRGEMNAEQFEVVCTSLEETLEELTGGEWDMVDTKKQKEVRQHGH